MQNVAAAPAFDDRLPHDGFHRANLSSPSPPCLQRLLLIARALIHTNNVSKLSNGWRTTAGLSPSPQPLPALFAPSTLSRFQPFHPASKMHSVCLFRPQNAVNTEHERDIDCRFDWRLHDPLTSRDELYARINISAAGRSDTL